MPVLNTADKVRAGSNLASAVYQGANKVWPPAGGWTPASISGLYLWLDASQLSQAIGASVTAWPNLAPQAQTVSIVGTPLPTISTTLNNGHKVVRLKANEARIRVASTGVDTTFTLVYGSRMIGPTADRLVSAVYPPANFLIGWYSGNMDSAYTTTGEFFAPNVQKSWTSEGSPSPWIMYSSDGGGSSNFYPRLFRNGTLLSTGNAATAGSGDGWGNTFNLSGYDATAGSSTSDCEVAEVCLYNRKLSDAERQQVESYQRTKWGLS